MTSEDEKVAEIRDVRSCTDQEAREFMDGYESGFEAGRDKGQQEVQRFFRLALGLEVPTESERAYWNHPVPLKEST